MEQNLQRTHFLIDGFNLYHSLKSCGDLDGGVRWLDIVQLCSSHLYLIDPSARLTGTHYFSAIASHHDVKSDGATERQRKYLRVLDASGVNIYLGKFKKKTFKCSNCNFTNTQREEKETDVAIALKLFELASQGEADNIVLISGDTDLVPALRTVKKLYPNVRLICAFPFERKNKELAQCSDFSFTFSAKAYAKNQFSNPYILKNKKEIEKPDKW